MTTKSPQSSAVTKTPSAGVSAHALTAEQVDLIKRTICRGATDDELALFLNVVKRTGLDPFSRQIHAVKRWDSRENREVMSIQTGIDGLRLIAQRTGEYGGSDDVVFDSEDGPHPEKATVTVYRMIGGQRVPIATKTARWAEYAQTKKNGDLTPLWARMPFLMLGKCAEALALRAAFPAELSSVYVEEELPRAVHPAMDGPDPEPVVALDDGAMCDLREGIRQAGTRAELEPLGKHINDLATRRQIAEWQVKELREAYRVALGQMEE